MNEIVSVSASLLSGKFVCVESGFVDHDQG